MASDRHAVIDYLRGFAMLAMILIHTNAYHLSDPTAYALWNYSQFAVQIFVFCSMYLFVKKNDFSKSTWRDLIHYYKKYIPKRFFRLVLPYYIFLPFYLFLQFIVNHKLPTTSYVLQSITLTGGVDINWLVLLFLQLTLLAPLLLFIFQKIKYGVMLVSSFIFLFILLSTIPETRHMLPNYRWVMWIGWSYFFLMGYRSVYPVILSKSKKRSIQILLGILAGIFVIASQFAHLYDRKYPPDLFFTIYGGIWILVLYKLLPKIHMPKVLENIIHFFSIYSYPLFFIHYWILVFVSVYFKLNWYTFFIVVLCTSAGVQWGYNSLAQKKLLLLK